MVRGNSMPESAAATPHQTTSSGPRADQIVGLPANGSKYEPTASATSGSVITQATESPPTSPGDNNIREGLGSLNRWSQSTASSKISTDHLGHYVGNHSRVRSTTDCGHAEEAQESANVGLSCIPPRAINLPTDGEVYHRSMPDQRPTDVNPTTSILQPRGIGTSPKFSAGLMGTTPAEVDVSEPTIIPNLFQNPWSTKGGETKDFQQMPPHNAIQRLHDNELPIDDESHMPTERRRRGHSQKAMLSKALQKANTAVLLDNAANFEGAMEAYSDACQLLQLVMVRSNGGKDEKLKLQEIRDTYMIRVTELQRMDLSFREPESKALPERPLSQESYGGLSQLVEEDEAGVLPRDHARHSLRFSGPRLSLTEESRPLALDQIPPRRQSLLPSVLDDPRNTDALAALDRHADGSHFESFPRASGPGHSEMVAPSAAEDIAELFTPHQTSIDNLQYSDLPAVNTHGRDIYESTSWLDTIDESGASSPASMGSKASSVYLRHRGSRLFGHTTEAEFDAALDAAVEAAYDEGLEPAIESGGRHHGDDIVANARRNVELAKQKVREAEREAEVAMTRGRDAYLEQTPVEQSLGIDSSYLDEEAEEEERLLEEMTREYVMDEFEFDLQSKSALPRQSDSSNLSGRTWDSSATSHATMAGAALSPLAEDSLTEEQNPQPSRTESNTPANASPTFTKPALPPVLGPSVRERRMSRQKTAELKIETRLKSSSDLSGPSKPSAPPNSRPPSPPLKDEPKTGFPMNIAKSVDRPTSKSAVHSSKRNASVGSFIGEIPAKTSLGRAADDEDPTEPAVRPVGKIPSAPDSLDKPHLGPKMFRARNVSIAGLDSTYESPGTPSNNAFPPLDYQRGTAVTAASVLPTPTGANFAPNGLPSGGLYLFDNHIHSPTSLGSPNLMATNAPLPLEPCPESFLLRPFWLMRCIFQTITHPRGGYLTTKLFVPRDVWRVKNVKLKAVEEKVSNCDLLTAALLKLAKVDTYDADAVLEEMQSLESILDQVQISLSKKVGSEVGVQGAMPLFKSSQSTEDPTHVDTLPPKSSTGAGKSYLSSWRKLRSKNSGFGATTSISNSKDGSRDNLTISSLPMTLMPSSQLIKHTVTQHQFSGPNANYMGALARLCDAAQVLVSGQIKLPSKLKTQVSSTLPRPLWVSS
ncbi:hypothetical protein N8T08_009162 [Aspergillus melleus]|uniref:Uncharacterized protein n=1 Tax=Aspergillus melleus TaxID=138277 RepID=A0ACC3AU40_9EURO|nr:hypothetical protein N8T08_009162 [Aspergillus melleus]